MIPYGRQSIDEDDIAAVTEVLRSDWLTTGPAVEAFENAVAAYVGAGYAVAFANGTAALHAMMSALEIGEGDEVITTPLTFVASANCVLYRGGTPVFADVLPDSLLLDPDEVLKKITPRTKAVLAVDYAGQPCEYDQLAQICRERGIHLLSDACHAIGAKYRGRKAGTLAQMTAFSFHPVKHITTGEGGMVSTDDAELAQRLRVFRNHGISTDFRQRQEKGVWSYDMGALGYNYRITDIQCALGLSQLRKLPQWLERRNEIARRYNEAFAKMPQVCALACAPHVLHAYHLYVIRIRRDACPVDRATVFARLRAAGIGVNVHYSPVYLHSYYRRNFGFAPGLCPVAEGVYEEIISLPMYPGLSDTQVAEVIARVEEAVNAR